MLSFNTTMDSTQVSTMPSISSLSTASSGPRDTPVFDYLICTAFDNQKGLSVTKQFPDNMPLISNQVDNLLGLLMPLNLHKFLNREHYTLIPLYVDSNTGLLSYHKDTPSYVPCYAYTISLFQSDGSLRNGTANAITIITRLPIVHVFKPLLYFLLQTLFAGNDDYVQAQSAFESINTLQIPQLIYYFQKFTSESRFVLARLEQGAPVLPKDLAALFPSSGTLFKATVDVGPIPFPIQIPASSLLCSRLCSLGSDLQKDSNIRDFLNQLSKAQLVLPVDFQESPLIPYTRTSPLHVLLNAMLLKKRIVFYCYDTCYNSVLDYGASLICLFEEQYPFYPILDLGTLELVETSPYYLVGTSNLLFKEKLPWDVYFDIDSNKIHYQTAPTQPSVFVDERRTSTIGTGIKNMFRRTSATSDEPKDFLSGTADSLLSESSSIKTLSSPDPLSSSALALWQPRYFPKVNRERTAKFLDDPKSAPHVNGFQPHKTPLTNDKNVPVVDVHFDKLLKKLLTEKHSDLTLYIVLTNYLRDLTTHILPAFYHVANHARLSQFQSFLSDRLDDENWYRGDAKPDVTLEMFNYIKGSHTIQPLPLNFKYAPDAVFMDDSRQMRHYTNIINGNGMLEELALKYSHDKFDVGSADAANIPGFLFDWQGEVLLYDPFYVSSILDKLLDDRFSQSWRINGKFLIQFYKAINQILKTDKNGLPKLLAAFFIGKYTDGQEILSNCHDMGLNRFNKIVLIATMYQVEKATDVATRKDLTLSEFKKVLSGVLNSPFFKGHMVHHLDDFMKLNVNDFIDYHM